MDEAFEFAVQFVDPSSVSGVANGVGTCLAESVANEPVGDFVDDPLDSPKRNKKRKQAKSVPTKDLIPLDNGLG